MSYILDALQRSDNERTISHVPTLGSGRRARRHRRTDWRRIVVGLLAIGLVLLLLALWYRAQLADMITDLRSGGATQSNVAANAPKPPQPGTATSEATQAPAQPRTQTRTVRIPVPPPAPRRQAPAPRTAPAQPAAVTEEVFAGSAGQNDQSAEQGAAPSVQETVQTAVQPASQGTDDSASAQSAESEVEDSDDLPSNVRQDLPQMQLNVVSFSSNPEKRFVMIDQKILREGDSAPGGMTIEEITSDGPIMEWRGRRFLMRP